MFWMDRVWLAIRMCRNSLFITNSNFLLSLTRVVKLRFKKKQTWWTGTYHNYSVYTQYVKERKSSMLWVVFILLLLLDGVGGNLYYVLRLDTLDLRTYWYVVNVPKRGGSCGLCFESFWYRNPKERGDMARKRTNSTRYTNPSKVYFLTEWQTKRDNTAKQNGTISNGETGPLHTRRFSRAPQGTHIYIYKRQSKYVH